MSCAASLLSSGFVSNGEYNSLRSTGYSRSLSVLKLKANSRSKYAQIGKTKMLKMLSPIHELSTCSLHKCTSIYLLDAKKCVVKCVLPCSQATSQSLGGNKQKLDDCIHQYLFAASSTLCTIRKAVGEPGNKANTY